MSTNETATYIATLFVCGMIIVGMCGVIASWLKSRSDMMKAEADLYKASKADPGDDIYRVLNAVNDLNAKQERIFDRVDEMTRQVDTMRTMLSSLIAALGDLGPRRDQQQE